jgi:hypothetical protein
MGHAVVEGLTPLIHALTVAGDNGLVEILELAVYLKRLAP